jgi:hypothetical protein
MAFEISNDGAVIRIENESKTFLICKDQIRRIDTVGNNNVRISLGEGSLSDVLINYQAVASPLVASALELRDVIKSWLFSNNYTQRVASEQTLTQISQQLSNLSNILQANQQNAKDFADSDPTLIDETNPNITYKGWHYWNGVEDQEEWAILRITRQNGITRYEWTMAGKAQQFKWSERYTLPYAPLNYATIF